MAFPFFYSEADGKWVKNGACQPVLFIMTEQKPEQIIKMILAYLSGVEESKFKFNTLTDDERKRIEVARYIIKTYKTLKLMRIPNPSIEQIKLSVREEVILSQRRYVFFDYIFISPGVLNEFRGHNLRNDEILSLMATALKDLAIEQNVSIFTSTQVNAKADDNSEIRTDFSSQNNDSGEKVITFSFSPNSFVFTSCLPRKISVYITCTSNPERVIVADLYRSFPTVLPFLGSSSAI